MAKKAEEKTPERASDDVVVDEAPLVDTATNATETVAVGMATSVTSGDDMRGPEESASAGERRSKRPRAVSSEKPQREAPKPDLCAACGTSAVAGGRETVLKCSSCQVTVHADCYSVGSGKDAMDATVAWTCDSCLYRASSEARACVYCTQPGDAYTRRVDTTHWPASYCKSVAEGVVWGHVMCAFWDPFRFEPLSAEPANPSTSAELPKTAEADEATTDAEPPVAQPSPSKTAETAQSLDFRSRLDLPVPACAYCHADQGVRIQCRRLNCGQFFHVRCAHTSSNGRVEVVKASFPQKHAYCARHLENRYDLSDLVAKLVSKTMASLVPREIATKLQGIARRVESYSSVDKFVGDLVNVLVEVCRKGLQASKTDPPTFSMRQLQAVQLVLDHLPQLRNVYDLSTLSKSDSGFVNDAEVFHALQRAFHPQRYVRKFAGPLSQFHQCDLCHEPFQERQHVFYCTSSEKVHALHWKCTKRKSAAKDSRQGGSCSTKKKSKSVSLVQQGHWKDLKLPKGLPSVGDGITCGVCRALVDGRGILASRKEPIRLDFEKPDSKFMFGGCFVNEMDPRAAAAAGLRTSRATMTTTAVQSSASSSHRLAGKSTSKRSSSAGTGLLDSESDPSAVMCPPKMERINVRRTTRWLACLGEVIRQVLAAKAEAKRAASQPSFDDGSATAATPPTLHGPTVVSADKALAAATDTVRSEHTAACAPASDSSPSADSKPLVEAVQGESEQADVSSKIAPPGSTPQSSQPDQAEDAPMEEALASDKTASEILNPASSSLSLPLSALPYLEDAKNVVRPYDAYALSKIESAHRMFIERSGPALSVLNTLIQEYTRFMYVKHTRAVEKATNEKRKRQELEAQEEHDRERKRIDREAELALKKQMLAMRKKQRG